MQHDEERVLLTQKEVMRMVNVRSRETIARWVKQRIFPKPMVVGNGQLRWLRSEIREWIFSTRCCPRKLGVGQKPEG